jgi:hypothetical protein
MLILGANLMIIPKLSLSLQIKFANETKTILRDIAFHLSIVDGEGNPEAPSSGLVS